jgi:hypothetical protein
MTNQLTAQAARVTSLVAVVLSAITASALLVVAKPAEYLRALSTNLDLLASQTLILHGTDKLVTPEFIAQVTGSFITPTTGTSYTPVAVSPFDTEKLELWPFTGITSRTYSDSSQRGFERLDGQLHTAIADNAAAGSPNDPIVVFGYSQGAQIASIEKQRLQAAVDAGAQLPPITFVLTANPIRPNGGLSARLNGRLGPLATWWTPIVSAPTNTQFQTYDVARQYDFFSDFPAYPLNPFATANAVLGLINHNYGPVTLDPNNPNYDPNTVVQQYGDTTYYLIPSKELPLLSPLRAVGLDPAADAVEPTLRVLVELGYDRTTPYGVHTPVGLAPKVDLRSVARDLQDAASEGAASGRASVTAAVHSATRKSPQPAAVKPRVAAATAASLGKAPVKSALRAARAAASRVSDRPQR